MPQFRTEPRLLTDLAEKTAEPGGITAEMLSIFRQPAAPEPKPTPEKQPGEVPATPQASPQEAGGITAEMLSIFQRPSASFEPAAPAATPPAEDLAERAARLERQAKRAARAYEPPVERSLAGEVAAGLGRGALGVAKLPFEVVKIVGADVLGSEKVRRAMEPILYGFEEMAESRALRPSAAAGGPPIDMDRLLTEPGDVARQIAANVTNPRFWAAQVPEAAVSMVPYFAGNLGARIAGTAFKYGKTMKAIQASEHLSEAEKAAKLAEIGGKLARLGTIGGFGAAMAMEAGEAERNLRQWEDETGKRVDWAPRVLSILGTGLVAGGLEAISTERIFFGKHGAPAVEGLIRKLFEGKGGAILARKILDSVATEGITEGAQQLVQNAFAKLGYDPDQKLTEGIVESVLIGAAVGGLAGAGGISHQAVKEYAPYLRELKDRAEQERRERLAQLPEVSTLYRTGPTPTTALAPVYPVPTEAEEAARIAGLPETSPLYRTGPAAGAPAEPLPPGPAPAAPLKDWEADILREPAPEEGAVGQARPLDLSGKPMMPPADRPLAQRLDALFRLVDETGDPRAAQEIHNLLLTNRPEVVAAFRTPGPVGMTLRPLAEKVESLYRQVEETGDFKAARQLHALIAANQQGLTGMKWEHLRRLAEQPMVQSAGEVKDLVRDEAMAEEEALPERVARLAREVEEEGDPRAAEELHRLLVANKESLGNLFRIPEEAREELRPLTGRLEELIRTVEETGDPRAARELNDLLAGNLHLLQGVSRGQISRLAGMAAPPSPMEPSGSQVKELAREPEGKTSPVAPFNLQTTDMPYYDNLLKNPEYFAREKGIAGRIEYMTPDEFLDKAGRAAVNESLVREYAERGGQMPLPVLDIAADTHEGRHRVLAAKAMGFERIPVLVVEPISKLPPTATKTPADTFAELDREKAERITRLEALPEGTRLIAPDFLGGSLRGTWRKTTLAGDPFWLNEQTGQYKTSESFSLFLKDLEFEPPRDIKSTDKSTEGQPPPAAAGRQSMAVTATGREVQTRFAVIEADNLITSHDDLLNENPAFPQELQPRDRTRAASEMQVSRIENNLRPELLGDNPLASDGAPIVGPDGIVESGNARTIALRRAYRANREQVQRYKQWLVEHAADFGLDPDAVRAAKRPVLVRVRQGEATPEERAELAKEFNMASTAGFSPMEQAENDARALLQTNILTLFEPNDRGEINTSGNAKFIQAFMQRVVSPNELSEYYTQGGKINQAGVNRIRNALFAAAYGKSGALEQLAESTDDHARNITGALSMTAPRMALMEQRIRRGDRHDLGIADRLAQAADMLQDIRQAGIAFEDGLARVKFLGGADPLVLDLLHLFNDYSRSRVRLQAILNNYLDLLDDLGTPKQRSLMEMPVQVTRADLLQKAVSQMEEKHGKGRESVPAERVEGEPQGPGVPGAPEKVEEAPEGREPTPKPQILTPDVIKRMYPDISDEQAAILAQDPELRAALARGNWEAILRQKAAEQASDIGAQQGLGIGGGLFDIGPVPEAKKAPEAPKPDKFPKTVEAVNERIAWLKRQIEAKKEERIRVASSPDVLAQDPRRQYQPGDRVWMTWTSILGTPTRINGEVYRTKNGRLRVRILSEHVGGARTTDLFDYLWVREGEKKFPLPQPIQKINEEIKALEAEESALIDALPQVARDQARRSFDKAMREGAEALDFAKAKEGDRILNHYDGKVYEVEKITDDEKYGRYLSIRDENDEYLSVNERDPDKYFTVVREEAPPTGEQRGGPEETTIEIIPYAKDLKIRNIEALPRGVGARYLVAIRGEGDDLIAKQWKRVPGTLAAGEVLIDFRPDTPRPKAFTKDEVLKALEEPKRLPALDAPNDEWAKAKSRIINEINNSDYPHKNTALHVVAGRYPKTWDRGTDEQRAKLPAALRYLGYDVDPLYEDEIINNLVTSFERSAPSRPKTNLEVLADLQPGGWQAFNEPFTDEEVALLEKAIEAGIVKVKQIGGETAYGQTGELKAWLEENKAAPEPETPAPEAIYLDILKTAADSPAELRPSDIARVLEEASERNVGPEFTEWLLQQNLHPQTQEAVLDQVEPEQKVKATASRKLAQRIVAWLREPVERAGKLTNRDLFDMANDAFGGTQAEGKYSPKDAYDAMELGVNLYIGSRPDLYNPHVSVAEDVKTTATNLELLLGRLPTQTMRTEEQQEFQQFSTPPPLAYVAAWVADMNQNDVVLEPSAGVGGLAVFAKNAGVKEVVVNELSPRRAALLKEMFFDRVYEENAEQIHNILHGKEKPTVVLMNPPFSATAGRIPGKRDASIVQRHVEQALKLLEPGGRLVAILGRGAEPTAATFRDWWAKIAKEYNVRANIGVSGKVYQKYGTGFGLRFVVIDKTGATAGKPVTGMVDSLAELIELLQEVKDARSVADQGTPGRGGKAEPGAPTEPVGERGPAAGERAGGQGVSERPHPPVLGAGERQAGIRGPGREGGAGGHGAQHVELEPGERHGGVGEERRRGRAGLGEHIPPEAGGEAGPGGPGGGTGGAAAQPDRGGGGVPGPEVSVEAKPEETPAAPPTEELADVIYEDYRPQRLKVPGAKPHPAHLMESAAMAAAVPPVPSYQPRLPKDLVEKGILSDAQMEAVVYAGQAHQETLPNGNRRGFFIGDGTGLGKGREIGAIFLDNWIQGRRKGVWISDKAALVKAAWRDVEDLGWDKNLVFEWRKAKATDKVERGEGIGFLSYDLLKASAKGEGGRLGKSRIDQLVEWLGRDFDGVIVFDESHKMGNALEHGTGRGKKKPSQRALAGIELQQKLPQARIVYVSATGATEVMNLAYAERLGLWGETTPFPTVRDFVNQIEDAGLAAMELVARDMKSMGLYLSRFLSYKGVETGVLEHELTPEQTEVYNELARAWQLVLKNIREVLKLLGADNNSKARSTAYSLFWSSHQRFFNQVITAMQMPGILKAVRQDLEGGHAAVLQLTNTLEANQERELAKLVEKKAQGEDVDLDEMDLSPRNVLLQYVEHAFPVHEYIEIVDEDGNSRWEPAKDSEGNNIVNPEAEARKQELLKKLGALPVPDGVLNQLLREFGPDQVAEVTGRKRRMVWAGDEAKLEKRSDAKVEADIDAFLEDKKRILVFSDKGGTGRSYHADLRVKNQRLRKHYLVQPGWRADNALQGFGRTHRSNQAQPPHYVLVTTNLKGQKRFISSIARRLDQLGALTRGQRQAGSGGVFRAKDNLESTHAKDGLVLFYRDLHAGRVEGLSLAEFEKQTGLRLTEDDGRLRLDLPPITQFLNRLLSLEIDQQNRVFDAFYQRVEEAAEAAAEAGTLDVGVETWITPKGGRLEKVSEKTVYTEPRTGAETKYVQIKEVSPSWFYEFEDVRGRELYVNRKSGNVWAAARQTTHRTLANGEVVRMRQLQGPRSRTVVVEAHLSDPNQFRKVDEAEAEALWNKEIAAAPKEKERTLHFITGAVLPIWDRLSGGTKVYRLQTSQGERLLGRIIADRYLGQTLRKLGAVEPVRKSPQELFAEVMERNKVLRLANDWTIERRRVAGEDRIELRGPNYHDQAEIFRHGVFSTLIQYRTRYFIPTDPRVGPQVLERLLKDRPVVAVTEKAVRGAFKVAPRAEAGETVVTQAMVEAAFPGAEVRRGRFFDGFRVLLSHGLEIGVRLNGDILLPDAQALRAAGYSEEDIRGIRQNANDYVLAGHWRVIDGGGVITLAKGLTPKEARQTLRHEVFHAACDLVLTDRERQTILKEFGDWESAARAYETWEPAKPHGLFQKILDFFRQIWEAFRPTWGGTFRRIGTGEVWQRQPRQADVFGVPIRYKAKGPANYEKTGNLPEDFVKIPQGATNFGEINKEAAKVIRRQAGPIRLQVGKGDARSGFGLIHIKARHEEEILRLGYPNVESFIHDVAANFIQIRQGRGAALLLVKPNGLNKIAAVELAPGEAEDFYTIKSAWVGRPEYIEKFKLLWERRVPVAAAPGKAPSLSSSPQRPEKGTPDAEGQSNLSYKNIIVPEEKGKGRYSIRPADQADIDAYRGKYLAPTEPAAPRGVVETAKDIKDSFLQKAQRFYDQVVDKWAAWERLAERAGKAGAGVPMGEHLTNALSFMRGVEGRVRQGLTGEYVYQDRMAYDPDLETQVFTGDDLVRKGPSFNRRLEPLRELAERRGVEAGEVMDDFEVFLVAQRDLELAGETGVRQAGEIKGVHPEESRAVLASLERKYGKDYGTLAKTADFLREWSDEMVLQPLLQAGFLDEAGYRQIKARNQYYAPYKRLLDQVNDYVAAHLGAEGVRGRVLHEIKGSEKQILSPLQTWIELAYKANFAYARNKVYRAAWLTGKAYEEAGVHEVPAKYVPVDFTQKQEIDVRLRRELMDLARDLKVDVKMVRSLRGRRLGEFSRMLKEEVSEGLLPEEAAGQIRVRFATSEKTLSHELGHALDAQYGLVDLLITRGTPEMRRELRRIADQRATQADSKSYKRYVRKRSEQVAEFVNRYINDRATAKAIAPETTAAFEKFLNQHARLKPLLTFKPSAQAGLLDFQNRVWARSPLPPEPGCVPYYRDGQRRWLKLPPDLHQAARNLMPSETGILMQLARVPADLLRSGAILVPEFSLGRNPIRDIIQAWIFSRFGFSPFKWFRDAALLLGKDEATREFRRQWEAGGGVLSTLAESFVEPQKISADYLKGKEGKVKYFANPLHALRYAAAYLENLTRFSIYKQAREKGLSHAEAIHEARRTTLDYSRAGGHPTVRYLNTLIPFWNAAVQGMDKLATELAGPNRKAVARRLAGLAGFSILVYLFARTDDRYKELEDWERNYFWHLPLGPDAPLLRLPKPFEAGILFGSVFERLAEAWITKDVKGVKSALAAAWQTATPEVIPTIARPYVEGLANYDFFRGRPIEDVGLQRLPRGLRAKPWISETAKAVGRLTDISPVMLEHFIRQWTGGLGANYFFPGIDLVLRKAGLVEDVPPPARDKIQQVWGVRTFFTQPPTGWRARSVNDFFERYQEVLQADQGWKALWQSGDTARLEKFLAEHPEAMYARVARKLMDEISKVKKERHAVHASKALTPEQKREKLEALDDRVVELAKLGNAFMSAEAAAAVKMPPRRRTEMGVSRPLAPEDYYEAVSQPVYAAFKEFQGRGRWWQSLDADGRDDLVEALLRRSRRETVVKFPKKKEKSLMSVI
ncbi:MAG: strawberry notch family protein [Deltaproteobacteria bacterium]|nr:strawberry notch family protein [Deltaproteobacteria bacterium]